METAEDLVGQLEEQQPTRTGKHRPPRRFDKTQLKSSHHGRYVHRDYLAHAFRWGWVSRQLERGMSVLDVGCGQELPLMWILSGNMSVLPSLYLGVDLNEVPFDGSPKWARVLDKFSFVDRYDQLGDEGFIEEFDRVVCFEVIEHMGEPDQRKLLSGLGNCVKADGLIYLSTPVFDGKAAVNHVRELTIPQLASLVEEADLEVVERFGTFASAPAIKRAAKPEHLAVYEELWRYYGGDVMSTFLAPLYPDHSRNNLWVLRRKPSLQTGA